ncbi:helix-turn-helix domain-containing protein [Yinghuangia aomiensis]
MAGEPSYARRELGAELKRLREAAKLTQARIGAACHWSQSKIVRLERGEASSPFTTCTYWRTCIAPTTSSVPTSSC